MAHGTSTQHMQCIYRVYYDITDFSAGNPLKIKDKCTRFTCKITLWTINPFNYYQKSSFLNFDNLIGWT